MHSEFSCTYIYWFKWITELLVIKDQVTILKCSLVEALKGFQLLGNFSNFETNMNSRFPKHAS